MSLFLEVRTGPHSGSKIRLTPGHPVRIGRTKASDFAFAEDTHMSGAHFAVEAAENGAQLTDLNSRNGLFLNGHRVISAPLASGDTVIAGETTFAVIAADAGATDPNSPSTDTFPAAENAAPAAAIAAHSAQNTTGHIADQASTAQIAAQAGAAAKPTPAETPQDRLLALLREDFQPLYAILDTARDIRILALLLHHKEECQSLYEGEQGAKLAQVAPYLVRLHPDSPLLAALVNEGWGKSWGIYLTSPSDLQEVRRHLRHFLQVKLPSGEQVYFRFYDPRVMRVFLPTCTPEDATQFFGPIQNYLVEDETPKKLYRFVNTGKGSERMMIALVDDDDVGAEGAPTDAEPETETWHGNPPVDERS